ncbi:MAG: membrane protein insertase YidC [Erysipelotrichaceae bacterium]|nr:membrane protein insertase YidC [Erysipelotrichaceae bacterium]
MKKILSNKKFWILICVFGLLLLSGCQRNTDAQGNVLPERIIYLSTPWTAMLNESILTAILVYPLAQLINFIGGVTGSGVLGVVITTLLYNALTMVLSIKSTVSQQKMQMIQPELNKIQAKYEGKTDDNSRMQMYQEQQALMNKYGVNPMASLGTVFLSFPIMIAMFYAAQRADVVVNGTFLGVPLQKTPWDGFTNIKEYWPLIIIFVFMVIMQFGSSLLPQYLANKRRKSQKNYKAYADDGSANNSQMNTMMYSMILMVVILGIRWPSAMSVYWAVSSFANIIKTLFIQRRYIDNAEI